MKILQVIQFFAPKYGGSFAVASQLTKHLTKLGHEVTVITTDFEIDENFGESLEGVEIIPFHCQYNIGGLLLSTSMNQYLQENIAKFDIIHMHNFRTYQNIIVHKYAKKYNVPYILQAHGSTPRIIEKKGLKYVYDIFYGNKLLKDALNVIAVSNVEVDQYLQMNIPSEKIITIPNGIDTNSFCKLPEKGTFRKKYDIKEKHIILFLGRLHKIKGIDFLIKAYVELMKEKKEVILVLAGPDDGYRDKAELLINRYNLKNNVKFVGFIDGLDKLAAYVDADVLVYPSIFEIFGLVPFEAIMSGTPVIVTDNCGCGELIKESKSGYLVRYGNIDDLKEKLKLSIEGKDYNVFVDNGRDYVERKLSWESIVFKMESLYEDCIPNK
jgi:glycosyltransferase involved in cell wall biosynthesis